MNHEWDLWRTTKKNNEMQGKYTGRDVGIPENISDGIPKELPEGILEKKKNL